MRSVVVAPPVTRVPGSAGPLLGLVGWGGAAVPCSNPAVCSVSPRAPCSSCNASRPARAGCRRDPRLRRLLRHRVPGGPGRLYGAAIRGGASCATGRERIARARREKRSADAMDELRTMLHALADRVAAGLEARGATNGAGPDAVADRAALIAALSALGEGICRARGWVRWQDSGRPAPDGGGQSHARTRRGVASVHRGRHREDRRGAVGGRGARRTQRRGSGWPSIARVNSCATSVSVRANWPAQRRSSARPPSDPRCSRSTSASRDCASAAKSRARSVDWVKSCERWRSGALRARASSRSHCALRANNCGSRRPRWTKRALPRVRRARKPACRRCCRGCASRRRCARRGGHAVQTAR